MKSTQYQEAEKRIHEAYDNIDSIHYRNNERFRWAINSLNEKFKIDSDSIECKFCSWHGEKSELQKNGHCPKCQSPSTKQ
jgi:predicted Zn-ribbon and HTH transcriptional regulator